MQVLLVESDMVGSALNTANYSYARLWTELAPLRLAWALRHLA